MKRNIIVFSITCFLFAGCSSAIKGKYVLSIKEENASYADGHSVFEFNAINRRFSYFATTEKSFAHSSGIYTVKNKTIVFASDTDIYNLPVHTNASKISAAKGKYFFCFDFNCFFPNCKGTEYSLIINDSLVYPIISVKDTLIVHREVESFRIRLDISSHYEQNRSDTVGINLNFYTLKQNRSDANNLYNLKFNFNQSLMHYEVFRNDSAKVLNKREFKLLKYGVYYRKKK